MKKIFKSRVFAFVLGAIMFSGITAVSAYTILANDIGYTPKDTTWKKSNGEDITNVKDAIDELYSKSINNKNNILWINEENLNSMSETELDVDLSEYSSIIILGYVTSDLSNYKGYTIINKNSSKKFAIYYNNSNNAFVDRTITVENNKIIIHGDAKDHYGTSTSNGNNYCIPIEIIGVK